MKTVLVISHTNKLPNRELLIIRLLKNTYRVVVIMMQRQNNFTTELSNCEIIKIPSRVNTLGLLLFYYRAIYKAFKMNFQVVYAFNHLMLPMVYFICLIQKKPFIYDYMEFPMLTIASRLKVLKKKGFRGVIYNLLNVCFNGMLRRSSGLIGVDSRNGWLLRNLRILQNNCAIINNYPSRKIIPEPTDVNIENKDEFALVYAGGIATYKGLTLYLDLIRSLRKKGHCVRLVLIGVLRDVDKKKLQSYINERNISEHVKIHEYMPYPQLLYILSHCHLGLSLHDPNFVLFLNAGQGNTRKIYTYMQAGLPFITSSPQLKNFVKRENVGVYIDYCDFQGLISGVEKLIKDNVLRQEMARCSQMAINNQYNWEKEQNKVNVIFGRALKVNT